MAAINTLPMSMPLGSPLPYLLWAWSYDLLWYTIKYKQTKTQIMLVHWVLFSLNALGNHHSQSE